MRKVDAGLFISLDGVVEAPHEWHLTYWSDEMGEVIDARIAASDAILLGRGTYDEFAAYWPKESPESNPLAAYMNDTPKYVVSTTLDRADWKNTTVLSGELTEEIRRLKALPGKDIAIIGSGTLVASLLQADLLDELDLLVHPVVVNHGKRLFGGGGDLKGLTLARAKTFDTGVLALTYRPAPAN